MTQQQVYDYLQKQDIKLEGTFYPQQERYKAADERAYKVIFLDREDVRTQKLFGEPAGSARFKLPSRIYVAAKGQLEDVVGNFIEGTIRADAKECKIEENIPFYMKVLSFAGFGLSLVGAITYFGFGNRNLGASLIWPGVFLTMPANFWISSFQKGLEEQVKKITSKKIQNSGK
ncbi:hypothetical protein B6U80_00650 [Candidatus Pacearchaeota archaeon ex4484_26]|nr:MAG: hypothetical protein B6U80_00650 [Candidatus Pacearchaeota archaeon ex4484_26]